MESINTDKRLFSPDSFVTFCLFYFYYFFRNGRHDSRVGPICLLIVPSASCLFLSPPCPSGWWWQSRSFWPASKKKEKEKRKQKAVEGDGMKCFSESPEFVNNRVATLTLVVCYQFFGVGGEGIVLVFLPGLGRARWWIPRNRVTWRLLLFVVVVCCPTTTIPPQGEEIARRAGIVLIFYFPSMGVSRSNCGPELFHDG